MSRSKLRITLRIAVVLIVFGAGMAGFTLLRDLGASTGSEERSPGFGIVGLFLAGAATVIAVLAVRRYRQIQYLLRHGLRLEGSIVGFEKETNTTRSDKGHTTTSTSWFVVVQWTDRTGQVRRERSDALSEDPTKQFSGEDNVAVLVDSKNPKLFWIDLFGESRTEDLVPTVSRPPVVRR